MRTVSRISVTPVRGFALLHPQEVVLTEQGVAENRHFLLIDAEGRRLRSSLIAWPVAVHGSRRRGRVDGAAFAPRRAAGADRVRLGDPVEPL